ncbi:MAG: dipeptidyl-peptidase 3 family protein [Bacteroidales bacterium]
MNDNFVWQTEQFADIRILRYRIEGFENLSLQQKIFVWYLYQAALSGRDIYIDQNYKHNLLIRKCLESIFVHYCGARNSEPWKQFSTYLKQFWFSNGIHHHNSMDKLKPEFKESYFKKIFMDIHDEKLPLSVGQSQAELYKFIKDQIFNPEIAPKKVLQDEGTDHVLGSAVNFYENLTQAEVEAFYASKADASDTNPVSHGLNSKLIKKDGQIKQMTYKSDGMYGKAIRKIVILLEHAKNFTESDLQRRSIEKLVEFYETGDLKAFDEYSILWVQDTSPTIDFVNGFIEVYDDPMGFHGSWQSMVSIRDEEATKRFQIISSMAGWFEQNSPIDPKYKREDARGVSYKVIQAIVESGDCSPTSPIGVNLPNADWIRAEHGSKSVSLGNIEDAYENSSKSTGSLEEFYLPDQQKRIKEFGQIASKMHTALHEVIGHGSGKLAEGVSTPKESLKSYSNTIEEARADLVALYYITDPEMITKGLLSSEEAGKAEYDGFMLNGLMRQLVRVSPGQQLEESHARNRQLIAQWVYEKGKDRKVVELLKKKGKTFVKINDYKALRVLFGELLAEIQRVKSEGDYEGARMLVETYGVKVDPEIHAEMLERWAKLNIAPFAGFINPKLEVVMVEGKIKDVKVSYPDDFTKQMIYYGQHYAFVPAN